MILVLSFPEGVRPACALPFTGSAGNRLLKMSGNKSIPPFLELQLSFFLSVFFSLFSAAEVSALV
jgi:hypothetical protein